MNTQPVDAAVLATLKDIMGNDYSLLVDTYLGDSEHRLAQIHSLPNGRSLREAAHSFKGSSSNMGAVCLAAYCGQLEHLPLEADDEHIDVLRRCIVAEFDQVRAYFLAERRPISR